MTGTVPARLAGATAPAGPCVAPGNRPYFLQNTNATRGQIAKIVYLSITGPSLRLK